MLELRLSILGDNLGSGFFVLGCYDLSCWQAKSSCGWLWGIRHGMGSLEHCQWNSFCSHHRPGWTFCSLLQIGHLLSLAALGSQQDRVSLRSPTLVTNDLAVWGSKWGLNLFLHITFSRQTHTVYRLADMVLNKPGFPPPQCSSFKMQHEPNTYRDRNFTSLLMPTVREQIWNEILL